MRTNNVHEEESIGIHEDLWVSENNTMFRDVDQRGYGRRCHIWLYTFSDLVLLLLAFFVMLYAMGTLDREGFRTLAEGFSTRPHPLVQREVAATSPDFSIDATRISPGQNIAYLRALISQSRHVETGLNSVVISMSDDRLVLSLPGALLFQKAGSHVRSEGLSVVTGVANLLSRFNNQIVVAARSDMGVQDREAWLMSLQRARSVARALGAFGYGKHVRVVGYGANRPVTGGMGHQIQPVDIVILPEQGM